MVIQASPLTGVALVLDGPSAHSSEEMAERRDIEATRQSEQHPASAAPTLTRAQVAQRLGISISSVRRLEGGALHPLKDASGVYRFAAAEVEAARASRKSRPRPLTDGELAAVAFRRFDEGTTLRALVIEFRQPPIVFRRLFREWTTSFEEGERQRRRAIHAIRRRDEERREETEARRQLEESEQAARHWERVLAQLGK